MGPHMVHGWMDGMVLFNDLCKETIASKLITFGANGVNVF